MGKGPFDSLRSLSHERHVRAKWLALLLAATLAPPALAAEANYLVSARADVRTRSPIPGESTAPITGDLELLPAALVNLRWKLTTLTLQYNPSVLMRQPHLLGPVTVLNRGRVQLVNRWERHTLSLLQEGAAGISDIGSLRMPEGALAGAVTEVQTAGLTPYVRSASYASFDGSPVERVGYSVTAGYLISGSPNAPLTMPLQWGPVAQARFRAGIGRLDSLTTSAQGWAAWFVVGHQQYVAWLTETWERQLGRTVTGSLGAGAAVTKEHIAEVPGLLNPPIPGDYLEVLPVTSVAVNWRQPLRGAMVQANATVRMAPFADRFTGAVYERLEARAQGEWRPEHTVTVTGAGGVAYAVPIGRATQAGDRVIFAEGGVVWLLEEWLGLGFLGRALWVEMPRLGTPGMLQWVATFSVTVQDRNTTAW